MTLYTNDYLEYYLTLVGWIIGNGIWDVLVASGIVALPIVVMVTQEWLKARSEGADEGNKGLLSTLRIEGRLYVAMAVIYFACIPAIPIDLGTLEYDTSRSTQCQVQVATPQQTRWSKSFTTLNNQSAQVPIWWFLVHAASKAVTGAAVAAIPCGTDLRQMRMDIDATRIRDPLLAQEVADFSHACYGHARARLFMKRPNLTEADMDEVNWIGSKFFLNTPGYYDYNWSVRSDMNPELKKKLTDAFLSLKADTPEGKQILELQRATRFIPTRVENYKDIESAARDAGLLK